MIIMEYLHWIEVHLNCQILFFFFDLYWFWIWIETIRSISIKKCSGPNTFLNEKHVEMLRKTSWIQQRTWKWWWSSCRQKKPPVIQSLMYVGRILLREDHTPFSGQPYPHTHSKHVHAQWIKLCYILSLLQYRKKFFIRGSVFSVYFWCTYMVIHGIIPCINI